MLSLLSPLHFKIVWRVFSNCRFASISASGEIFCTCANSSWLKITAVKNVSPFFIFLTSEGKFDFLLGKKTFIASNATKVLLTDTISNTPVRVFFIVSNFKYLEVGILAY
jgi:hypothetical protein